MKNWALNNVMLVGDASLMPVRYRQVQQVPKEALADGTYNPSELYYANLYQGHVPGQIPTDPLAIKDSGLFETWDQNGNGRYNEQHWNAHLPGNHDHVWRPLPAAASGDFARTVTDIQEGRFDDVQKEPRHRRPRFFLLAASSVAYTLAAGESFFFTLLPTDFRSETDGRLRAERLLQNESE